MIKKQMPHRSVIEFFKQMKQRETNKPQIT